MIGLKEQIADLCHSQWSGWMEYLFSKCAEGGFFDRYENVKDGTYIIPTWAVDRWTKQMKTDYKDLSEEEKNSDRTEADKFINLLKENSGQISDGFHTFDQLYDHRITLFIKLCEYIDAIEEKVDYDQITERYVKYKSIWRSKKHSDGSSFDGWFIMGINKEKGKQITYHLPMDKWELTDFTETLDKAPEWDGHTSGDVIKRLLNL